MDTLLITVVLLVTTFFIGKSIESFHYMNLSKREKAFGKKATVSFGIENLNVGTPIKKAELVIGEVVIGCDYFKIFVAGLKSLFGGRLETLESLLERGRREAIIRMKEKAKDAHCIVNTRIDTVRLNPPSRRNSRRIQTAQTAIVAYGTAITFDI